MELLPGVYETLITAAIEEKLSALEAKDFFVKKEEIDSAEGQRIINQRDNGWRYILFVRDSKKDEFGNTNAYYCLGLMDFDRYSGECPMNVVWNMQSAIPAFLLQAAKAV